MLLNNCLPIRLDLCVASYLSLQSSFFYVKLAFLVQYPLLFDISFYKTLYLRNEISLMNCLDSYIPYIMYVCVGWKIFYMGFYMGRNDYPLYSNEDKCNLWIKDVHQLLTIPCPMLIEKRASFLIMWVASVLHIHASGDQKGSLFFQFQVSQIWKQAACVDQPSPWFK